MLGLIPSGCHIDCGVVCPCDGGFPASPGSAGTGYTSLFFATQDPAMRNPALLATARAIASVALLTLAAGFSTGCSGSTHINGDRRIVGSGNVITVSRTPSGFHAVSLTGLGKLIVTQGNRESVSITTDDNVAANMESSVINGVLHLNPSHGAKIETRAGVIWEVTVRRLESLHTDGLVIAEAINIVGDTLHVDMEGLSQVTASGSVGRSIVDADGIINYDGRNLESDECELDCDGILTLSVHAHRLVHGRACGTGSLEVYGQAALDLEFCPLVIIRRR
jgi:hypothetical protein